MRLTVWECKTVLWIPWAGVQQASLQPAASPSGSAHVHVLSIEVIRKLPTSQGLACYDNPKSVRLDME